jgi:hypothetical protein
MKKFREKQEKKNSDEKPDEEIEEELKTVKKSFAFSEINPYWNPGAHLNASVRVRSVEEAVSKLNH